MNDFISREAVIKAVDDYTLTNCPKYMHDWATNLKRAILEDVKSDIDNIPAADVQPVKRGHWFLRGGNWCCSACNKKTLLVLESNVGGCRQYGTAKTNYCPNCGAKMEEE